MLTTTNPQYGHYLVRKMPSSCCTPDYENKYGVFRINRAAYSYDDGDNTDPRKAYKVDLYPIGFQGYTRRDWYACDVLKFNENNAGCQVFDNYAEALNWANSLNTVKEVCQKKH